VTSQSLRDYGLVLTLSLIWGSSFLLVKIAVADVPPLTMAASRVAIAFAVLYAVARWRGDTLTAPWADGGAALWGHFLIIGMLGNGIPFTMISWGEIEVSSALAAILIGVMPVFTVVFAHSFGVERLTGGKRLAGIIAGFAGLVVLIGPAALLQLGHATMHEFGIIAAAASYAATGVYARRFSLRMSAVVLSAGAMAASSAVMVPAALILETPWRLSPGFGPMAAVIALGALATGIASIIYFRLLAAAGPTFASTVNYLIPVFGAILGVVLLSETLETSDLIALALILSGIALVRNPMAQGQAAGPGTER
jgi:drug/metabolite transporter (DMT)-like permease